MALTRLVIFSVLITIAFAKVAKNMSCEPANESCSVSEIRIEPCKNKNRCLFHHGDNATISFDFTPNFVASNLRTSAYCSSCVSNKDIEFSDMGTNNACELTTCPSQAGVSQTLDYTLYIANKFPQGKYTLKWKVWDEDNNSNECCFQTKIQIKRN